MTITSPASGAHVHGAATVTAEVSGSTVAGVQFLLDGVSLGAEDTTAPYSVPWDTTSASEGWHTLTAVARDTAGLRSSSAPVKVTVGNSAPPSVPTKRYEDTDASVSYSAGWTRDSSWPWSGGSSAQARTPGARATFTFTGTSVAWIGHLSAFGGIARVSVDGVFVADVDLFARATIGLRVPVFTMTGLPYGSHTLTIETTDRKNPGGLAMGAFDMLVVVDAFDVPATPISRLQDTDPAIAYSAGWTFGDFGKTQWSGVTAAASSTAGAQATLAFSGTSISWIGYRGPDAGLARVYIDGRLAGEVDTYSALEWVQDNIFTASGLADGSHTLTIEVTGLKNDASTGTLIAVDAFDVGAPGTRFEETDWSVSYSEDWTQKNNRNHPWSQGSIAASNAPGSQVTFAFTGTSVSWIGRRGPQDAIAHVYVDGVFAAELDNYAATDGYQNTLFTASGLTDTRHTLTIEATGRKNPASTMQFPWVVVDAFDVRRPQQQPPAPPSPTARSEESAASYAGTWASYGAETGTFSGGTIVASPNAMNTASFSFTGSAVSWIGVKCDVCGIATVQLDGGVQTTVNTAGPKSVRNLTSEPVFSASGLDPAATHTMVITVTGTTTSGGAYVAVDAFDVTP